MEEETKREISEKEKEIRSITKLYYSRKDVQKAIFEFSKNREISPRYFEGFGKRPDSFQYIGDVYGLVKKGATSFHVSEEIWENPLEIKTGMSEKEANELRIGWDLLIDIDCEHGIEKSALAAKAIVETFKQHGIKNYGIKFSGSKGFHILLPYKAFPKEINGEETKNLFPELPRKLIAYIRNYSGKIMNKLVPKEYYNELKDKISSGYRCERCGEFAEEYRYVEFYCDNCNISEIKRLKMGTKGKLPLCYKCKKPMNFRPKKQFQYCERCNVDSITKPENFKQEDFDIFALMGLDLVLVSPRHLFRAPYSLHEKSSLVSVVITEAELENFTKKLADPLRIKVKNFMPESVENEAKELVMQALDWAKESGFDREVEKKSTGKYENYKPIKLTNLTEEEFPPCIKKILEGMNDGKKRALFALINFFRSIGLEKEDLEKRIYEWNEKNPEPLKRGYISTQLSWFYKRKPVLPPNCREFYKDLGVCTPDSLCQRIKNPTNYSVRKNHAKNNKDLPKKQTKKAKYLKDRKG